MMRPLILLLAALLFSLPVQAAEKELGRFGVWRSFRFNEGDQPVCYMIAHPPAAAAARPVAVKGKKGKKAAAQPREAYITVTFRPHDSMFPVFSYNAGTILKDTSESTVVMGKQSFSLFASSDAAWARTSGVDQAIVRALRKAPALDARAQSARGGKLSDRFTLNGTEAAYKKIATACGIP